MTSASTPPARSIRSAARRRRCRPGVPGPPGSALPAPPLACAGPAAGATPPARRRRSPAHARRDGRRVDDGGLPARAGRRRRAAVGAPARQPAAARAGVRPAAGARRRDAAPPPRRPSRSRPPATARRRPPLAAPALLWTSRWGCSAWACSRRWWRSSSAGWSFDVPSANQTAVTQVATFNYADGAALATDPAGQRQPHDVTLDQVPEHVRHAVLAAEDRSLLLQPRLRPRRVSPGPLWNQVTRRGRRRLDDHPAVREGLHRQDRRRCSASTRRSSLTVKISQEQTKDQILENYLNTIYLGRGAYGIQAASQAYFGKDVRT